MARLGSESNLSSLVYSGITHTRLANLPLPPSVNSVTTVGRLPESSNGNIQNQIFANSSGSINSNNSINNSTSSASASSSIHSNHSNHSRHSSNSSHVPSDGHGSFHHGSSHGLSDRHRNESHNTLDSYTSHGSSESRGAKDVLGSDSHSRHSNGAGGESIGRVLQVSLSF